MYIIIVDDEVILRKTLKAYLEDEGHSVATASNGADAVDFVREGNADIMIVDMQLPDIKGDEVIRRSARLRPSMKFIVHTGDGNYLLPPSLVQAGLSERNILIKPILNLSVLNDIIRDITGS